MICQSWVVYVTEKGNCDNNEIGNILSNYFSYQN